MKSAYELAMERLEKQSPSAKVTEELRAALAEIDATYKARVAEREVFPQSQLQKALSSGQAGEADDIRVQLSREVRRLQEECEHKKAKARGE